MTKTGGKFLKTYQGFFEQIRIMDIFDTLLNAKLFLIFTATEVSQTLRLFLRQSHKFILNFNSIIIY